MSPIRATSVVWPYVPPPACDTGNLACRWLADPSGGGLRSQSVPTDYSIGGDGWLQVHLRSWGEEREPDASVRGEGEGERKIRCWDTERGREGQETEGQASNRGWEVGASNTHGNNDGESDSRSRREDKRKRKIFLRGNKAARAIRGSGAYII